MYYDGVDGFVHELRATVRECIDCGALIAGGPTRCIRCAKEGAPSNNRLHLTAFGACLLAGLAGSVVGFVGCLLLIGGR